MCFTLPLWMYFLLKITIISRKQGVFAHDGNVLNGDKADWVTQWEKTHNIRMKTVGLDQRWLKAVFMPLCGPFVAASRAYMIIPLWSACVESSFQLRLFCVIMTLTFYLITLRTENMIKILSFGPSPMRVNLDVQIGRPTLFPGEIIFVTTFQDFIPTHSVSPVKACVVQRIVVVYGAFGFIVFFMMAQSSQSSKQAAISKTHFAWRVVLPERCFY